MQLLRDNLTLWTSSDSADAEATQADAAPKESEKPAEAEKAEEPKEEVAPATES